MQAFEPETAVTILPVLKEWFQKEEIPVPSVEYITDLERSEQIMYVSSPRYCTYTPKVCRFHPELLKALFEAVPFLGTKKKGRLYVFGGTEKPFVALLFSQLYLRPLVYLISRYKGATPML